MTTLRLPLRGLVGARGLRAPADAVYAYGVVCLALGLYGNEPATLLAEHVVPREYFDACYAVHGRGPSEGHKIIAFRLDGLQSTFAVNGAHHPGLPSRSRLRRQLEHARLSALRRPRPTTTGYQQYWLDIHTGRLGGPNSRRTT